MSWSKFGFWYAQKNGQKSRKKSFVHVIGKANKQKTCLVVVNARLAFFCYKVNCCNRKQGWGRRRNWGLLILARLFHVPVDY